MQFGYTIPLQKHLHIAPPYGAPCDLRFCWETHLLRLDRAVSVITMQASSSFMLLFYRLPQNRQADLPALLMAGIEQALLEEGFSPAAVARYFAAAGGPLITRTHGRSAVGCLNRAVDALYGYAPPLDPERMMQPHIRELLNDRVAGAAGHREAGPGVPRQFLWKDMQAFIK